MIRVFQGRWSHMWIVTRDGRMLRSFATRSAADAWARSQDEEHSPSANRASLG